MDHEREQPDQQSGKPKPEHEDTGRDQLQRHQHETEDQPVPGPQRGKHLGHIFYPWRGGVAGPAPGPAFGTDERRAAACADAALSPNVALAISPMPASDPSMLMASIGRMMIFWCGETAI